MKDACEGQITLHGFLLNSVFVPSPAQYLLSLTKFWRHWTMQTPPNMAFNARHKIQVNGNWNMLHWWSACINRLVNIFTSYGLMSSHLGTPSDPSKPHRNPSNQLVTITNHKNLINIKFPHEMWTRWKRKVNSGEADEDPAWWPRADTSRQTSCFNLSSFSSSSPWPNP